MLLRGAQQYPTRLPEPAGIWSYTLCTCVYHPISKQVAGGLPHVAGPFTLLGLVYDPEWGTTWTSHQIQWLAFELDSLMLISPNLLNQVWEQIYQNVFLPFQCDHNHAN